MGPFPSSKKQQQKVGMNDVVNERLKYDNGEGCADTGSWFETRN